MSDFTQGLTREIEAAMKGICRIRKVDTVESLRVLQDTYRERYQESTDTQMESYWRAALEIVDRRLASEQGFNSVGARERYS